MGNQALLRRLQAKLTIGDVNDPLEREADSIAEQVMRMPEPSVGISTIAPRVNRKCGACEEEDAQKLRTNRTDSRTGPDDAPDIVHDVLNAPGRPLDADTRAFMEPRFGKDFSTVRVHQDHTAQQSAQAVSARAYAVGNDIVFGTGTFVPQSDDGKRVIAHELAHVVQQGGGKQLRRQLMPVQNAPKYTPPLAGPYTGYQTSPFPVPPPTPCRTDPACANPVRGSSWDFAHKVHATQATEQAQQSADPTRAQAAGTARDAVYVKQFGDAKSPGLLASITVRVNPAMQAPSSAGQPTSPSASGQATNCKGAAPEAGQPACIEVPDGLERQAQQYATNTDPNARIAGRTRLGWETETLSTLTHEAQHVRFTNAAPVTARPTMNTQNVYNYDPGIYLVELDEMNSLLSEYPIKSRAIMVSTTVPAADKTSAITDWIATYAIANGDEDIRGGLTKLRCVSTCQDVNSGVTKVFNAQSANWTAQEKKLFLTVVNDPKYKLDWPIPTPAGP